MFVVLFLIIYSLIYVAYLSHLKEVRRRVDGHQRLHDDIFGKISKLLDRARNRSLKDDAVVLDISAFGRAAITTQGRNEQNRTHHPQ